MLDTTLVALHSALVAQAPDIAPTPTAIGAEIRRLRDSLGMTLEQFGRHVGVPWQTISMYESGRAVPPADRLLRILHETRGAKEPFRVRHVAREVARAAA